MARTAKLCQVLSLSVAKRCQNSWPTLCPDARAHLCSTRHRLDAKLLRQLLRLQPALQHVAHQLLCLLAARLPDVVILQRPVKQCGSGSR